MHPAHLVYSQGETASPDFDGKFTIAIRDGETKIIISYVGFESQEVDVEGQNNILVSLEQDVSELEEVVVIEHLHVCKRI